MELIVLFLIDSVAVLIYVSTITVNVVVVYLVACLWRRVSLVHVIVRKILTI